MRGIANFSFQSGLNLSPCSRAFHLPSLADFSICALVEVVGFKPLFIINAKGERKNEMERKNTSSEELWEHFKYLENYAVFFQAPSSFWILS